jgi:hypothetical protein
VRCKILGCDKEIAGGGWVLRGWGPILRVIRSILRRWIEGALIKLMGFRRKRLVVERFLDKTVWNTKCRSHHMFPL